MPSQSKFETNTQNQTLLAFSQNPILKRNNMNSSRRPSFKSSFSSFRPSSPLKSPTSKKSKKREDDKSENEILLESITSMSMDERQNLAEEILQGSFSDMNHSVCNHEPRGSGAEENVSPRRQEMKYFHQLRSFSRSSSSLPIDDDLSLFIRKLNGSCLNKESLTASPKKKNDTLMTPRSNKENLMSPRSRKELPPPARPRERPKKPVGRPRRTQSATVCSYTSANLKMYGLNQQNLPPKMGALDRD
jgi:hypothetical protein